MHVSLRVNLCPQSKYSVCEESKLSSSLTESKMNHFKSAQTSFTFKTRTPTKGVPPLLEWTQLQLTPLGLVIPLKSHTTVFAVLVKNVCHSIGKILTRSLVFSINKYFFVYFNWRQYIPTHFIYLIYQLTDQYSLAKVACELSQLKIDHLSLQPPD